jgi:deoxyadenosine/deoxycytidine kinase
MLIAVEGNIGAGKSTFLRRLEDLGAKVVYEPVDEWMSLRDATLDKSLLELFYEDKARYGFAFQMMILETRFASLSSVDPGELVFCERSLLTDLEVFANLMHRSGGMTDVEHAVYSRYQRLLLRLGGVEVDAIVYLRVTPAECVNRIRRRDRQGEASIDEAYVTAVHEAHETWLTDPALGTRVHTFDADGDVDARAVLALFT